MRSLLDTSLVSVSERWKIFSGVALILFSVYLGIGHRTSSSSLLQDPSISTWIDRKIPLSPIWLIVYSYMYFQTAAPFFVLKRRRSIVRWLLGGGLLYLLAVPLWILYPIARPGAEITVVDAWSYWLTVVYRLDPATNCLPSMHVALAFYSAVYIYHLDKAIGVGLIIGSFFIWYSTLAVKQHWFVDGAVAILLALMVVFCLNRFIPWKEAERDRQARVNHFYWLGAVLLSYAFLFVSYSFFFS